MDREGAHLALELTPYLERSRFSLLLFFDTTILKTLTRLTLIFNKGVRSVSRQNLGINRRLQITYDLSLGPTSPHCDDLLNKKEKGRKKQLQR